MSRRLSVFLFRVFIRPVDRLFPFPGGAEVLSGVADLPAGMATTRSDGPLPGKDGLVRPVADERESGSNPVTDTSATRRRVLGSGVLAAFPVLSGCQSIRGTGRQKRLVGVELQNGDDAEHRFETVVHREGEGVVHWSTATLPPDSFREVDGTWEPTGEFLVATRVDDARERAREFPAAVESAGPCFQAAPSVLSDGSFGLSFEFLGECP